MPTEDASKDQLLDETCRLHDELEKVPSYQEMNDHGEYSVYTHSHVFGSWNDAVESAGYAPHSDRTPKSKAELIAELEKVAEKRARKPIRRDMSAHGSVSPDTYSLRFGSWNDALKAAGFGPRTKNQRIRVGNATDELDTRPTTGDMTEKRSYRPLAYIGRFGS